MKRLCLFAILLGAAVLAIPEWALAFGHGNGLFFRRSTNVNVQLGGSCYQPAPAPIPAPIPDPTPVPGDPPVSLGLPSYNYSLPQTQLVEVPVQQPQVLLVNQGGYYASRTTVGLGGYYHNQNVNVLLAQRNHVSVRQHVGVGIGGGVNVNVRAGLIPPIRRTNVNVQVRQGGGSKNVNVQVRQGGLFRRTTSVNVRAH